MHRLRALLFPDKTVPRKPQPTLEERATIPQEGANPRGPYSNALDFEMSYGDKPAKGFESWESESADLRTNEPFGPEAAKQVSHLINPRYIIGIGFGNILVHASLAPALEGIVCIDTSPKVVSMGRATRHLLQEIDDAGEFIEVVSSFPRLLKALDGVELKEREYVFRTLPERVKYKDYYRSR